MEHDNFGIIIYIHSNPHSQSNNRFQDQPALLEDHPSLKVGTVIKYAEMVILYHRIHAINFKVHMEDSSIKYNITQISVFYEMIPITYLGMC